MIDCAFGLNSLVWSQAIKKTTSGYYFWAVVLSNLFPALWVMPGNHSNFANVKGTAVRRDNDPRDRFFSNEQSLVRLCGILKSLASLHRRGPVTFRCGNNVVLSFYKRYRSIWISGQEETTRLPVLIEYFYDNRRPHPTDSGIQLYKPWYI